MDKRIDHSFIETKWQEKTKDNFIVKFDTIDKSKEKYSIVLPPPNVTGYLHLGHAFNITLQDIIARYQTSQGKNVLWIPGLDHAGIATQTKVEEMLKQNGINRKDIGREKFIEEINKWKNKYGNTILSQIKKLGGSCDWSRLVFTMDDHYSQKVLNAFVKLYNDGLIYKGYYMINWCEALNTTISDDEVVSNEEIINFYYIKYQLDETNDFLTVATTRPETMFGDVALAFNPNDDKYKNFLGKFVKIPIINKLIPIISDDRIKIDVGTGLVKITPAHDKLDYEIGKTHNLDVISVINEDGMMCNVPNEYDQKYKLKVRTEIINKLTELNQLEKIDKKKSMIPRCHRTNCVIEPRITNQWFIKMKPLAEIAKKMIDNNEIKFYPERVISLFDNWINNIRDWCISRQLWWGHRIPVWYCSNSHINCQIDKPIHCNVCTDTNLIQDSDCLDTWNSSWLWSFAVFQSEDEFNYYFPLDLVVTGIDILFFWVMRMMMASGYFLEKTPFKKVYFNGIIRDNFGHKMSKSSGNAIDPLTIINKIGVDPMRFSFLMISPKDGDLLVSNESFDIGKTFCTKLWNLGKYLQYKNMFEFKNVSLIDIQIGDDCDKHIYDMYQKLISNIPQLYERMDFQELARSLYIFVWNDFANDYVEKTKQNLTDDRRKLIMFIYKNILILLYPIIPHVTQELYEIIGLSNLCNELFPV